jgi:hypothetical protein
VKLHPAERRFSTIGFAALLLFGFASGFGGHLTPFSKNLSTTGASPSVSAVSIDDSNTTFMPARGLPRFNPLAFTAIGDSEYWLLGAYLCARGRCLSILHTTDAGRRFVRIKAPPFPTAGTVPTLRFADTRDGFAYVQGLRAAMYVTHDGGAGWKRLSLGTPLAFATAGGYVYVVTAQCTVTRCTNYRLKRSPVFADHWISVAAPFTPTASIGGLAAHGSNVWLLGSVSTNDRRQHEILARSSDSGHTFVTSAGPCIPELGGDLEPSSARVVWAVCPTGLLARVWRSTDGGANFTPLAFDRLANSAVLAPASDTTAVLAPNGAGAPLMRTTDGGKSWRAVPGSIRVSDWGFIGFTDARTGSAIVQIGSAPINALWRTRDGGSRWANVRIPAPVTK